MAHQSLYRTYRPLSFDEVAGQEHVTRTLRNAVASGTVSHAYLFCGPRGTGKTTTARILAKALDCEQGPTPDPDNTCESCIDIMEGRHPDVYELDAASRTGVENVREEIISRVAFAPARGRMKLYIIDEVHMLSTSAFNALLKTLEEPPAHAVFVLCTTHPHKVPDTIQSRCQRFDFRRIGVEDIVARLTYIAQAEAIAAQPGVLELVARHAAGGMRDAISTLEQLAAFTSDDIGLADVEGLLGEVSSVELHELADLVVERDTAGAFRFVAGLMDTGGDIREFADALGSHFRDLYVASILQDTRGVIDTTAEQRVGLAEQATGFGPERLARCMDIIGKLQVELRQTSDPRLALEVALTRMARPDADLTLEALAERIVTLERRVAAPGAGGVPAPAPAPAPAAAPRPAPAPAPAPALAPARGAVTPPPAIQIPAEAVAVPELEAPRGPLPDRAALVRQWPVVLAEFKKIRPTRAYLFMNTNVDVSEDELVIEFPTESGVQLDIAAQPETIEVLYRAVVSVLGIHPPVRLQLGRGGIKAPAHAPAAPADPAPAAPKDVESMLADDFGADSIVDHPNGDAPVVAPPSAAPVPPAAQPETLDLLEGLSVEAVMDVSDEPPDYEDAEVPSAMTRPDEYLTDPEEEL